MFLETIDFSRCVAHLRVDRWGDLSFGSENENGFDIWITDEDFSNLPQRLQDMVYCARTE